MPETSFPRTPEARHSGRNRPHVSERSDAGDVAGEEVDAGSVEVAAGSVVVLVGAGVGVPGEDVRTAEGTPASRAFVTAACLSEWG